MDTISPWLTWQNAVVEDTAVVAATVDATKEAKVQIAAAIVQEQVHLNKVDRTTNQSARSARRLDMKPLAVGIAMTMMKNNRTTRQQQQCRPGTAMTQIGTWTAVPQIMLLENLRSFGSETSIMEGIKSTPPMDQV
jgi:hypothetical protein